MVARGGRAAGHARRHRRSAAADRPGAQGRGGQPALPRDVRARARGPDRQRVHRHGPSPRAPRRPGAALRGVRRARARRGPAPDAPGGGRERCPATLGRHVHPVRRDLRTLRARALARHRRPEPARDAALAQRAAGLGRHGRGRRRARDQQSARLAAGRNRDAGPVARARPLRPREPRGGARDHRRARARGAPHPRHHREARPAGSISIA